MSGILVTGANGFIGRALCSQFLMQGYEIRAGVRNTASFVQPFHRDVEIVAIGEIGPNTDWRRALNGMSAVVHLAGRVHVMHEHVLNPLDEFRLVNVAGAERLARAALEAGVKRFVYVSSIKVNGEVTDHNAAFTERDIPAPRDPYGVSKWEAEQALRRIATNSDLEIVIVRPPLVYGPGVGGNFIRLMKLVAYGVPLPFATVHNRRSLMYVGNLVDALMSCVTHTNARGSTYLVSDGEDITIAELIQRIAKAMNKLPRLFPLPEATLRMLGTLTRKSAELSRLLDSLLVNSTKIRTELEWHPPYSLEQGLCATVDWYCQRGNQSKKLHPD